MNRMRAIAKAILLAASNPALAGTITVNSLADNGPGNCNVACTLRDAIATANSGDTIQFNIALPWTIVLAGSELTIATPVSIVGPGAGLLSVSAANNSRVVGVTASNVTISGLTLRDGSWTGAFGVPGFDFGEPGGTGGYAHGGCVYVHNGAQLTLSRVAVTVCNAEAGGGGMGGNGQVGAVGGPGGPGGTGGSALGAIYSLGDLTIVQSSVTGCTLTAGGGGSGGSSGYGTSSMNHYAAGNGGTGGVAFGGGVYAGGGTLLIRNSTIGSCTVTGGSGGGAGMGAASFGGAAGAGGAASGGSVFVSGSALLADVEFSTLTGNTLTAGSGASYPTQASAGIIAATALDSETPSSIKSSIIASTSADPDCVGSLNAQGNNFDQNHTCSGFTLHGAVTQTLKPLAANADGTFSFLPVYASSVIDAAVNCALLDNSTLANDQHGTLRPQTLACDLGAIETDYVFVGTFE
jgi:CSLREA domain-containing protein